MIMAGQTKMKSVLIVDDDSDFVKLYEQAFLNAAFSVDYSLTIPKAEKLIKKKKYDVILLDILFPNADALSTIHLIRSKKSPNNETPIIVLTNLDLGEKTKKALKYGANECLFKVNHTPKTILEIAVRLVGNNRSQKEN